MGNINAKPPPNALQLKIQDCVTPNGKVDYDKLQTLKHTWELTECNIAIIGCSGTGKSTLINNLLNVARKSDDEETRIKEEIRACDHRNRAECNHTYAPTSSSECTTDAVPYRFEGTKRVILWDLPGYGAQIAPKAKEFWKKFNIMNYDAYLYVTRDSRISDNEKEITQLLVEQTCKPVFWIRTYFDAAVIGKSTEDIEQERKTIRTTFMASLGGDSNSYVYCVSGLFSPNDTAKECYLYDLDILKAAITKNMPEGVQNILARNFTGFAAELIEVKFEALQRWVVLTVLGSTAIATATGIIPLAGAVASGVADYSLIAKYYKEAAEVYGFSTAEEIADCLNIHPKLLPQIIDIAAPLSRVKNFVIVRLQAGIVAAAVGQVALALVPMVGAAVSGVVSLSTMTWACHTINTTFRDSALKVIKLILVDNRGAR